MKTYLEGDRFPGKVGRTIADSEAAFPMPPESPEGAPNVMYIVIDDIGFGWIEPFGGAIRTPNIDRLAGTGCGPEPSLGGDGQHPRARVGVPRYNARQPLNRAGIGAMLHDYGYTSFCIGKWHNTPSEETGSPARVADRWGRRWGSHLRELSF